MTVPDQSQRVEYLIDSITSTDSMLQATVGLVRANTNNMRNDFEAPASALIEVNPYRRSQKGTGTREAMSYDVKFPDGEVKEYCANAIAENMYAQVDAYGHYHTMLNSILDFRKHDTAVNQADMYIVTKSGNRRMRQTTTGWDLLILWKNGKE